MILNLRTGAFALASVLLVSGCDTLNKKEDKKDDKAAGGSTAAGPDMRDYMQVSSPQPNWPKDGGGLTPGWYYEKTSKSAAGTTKNKFAVVAVAGDLYKIECDEPCAADKGCIAALVVKKDGTVSEAYAGKPTGTLKKIKIAPTPAAGDAPKPEESDDNVVTKAGTFAAKKYVTKTTVQGTTYTSTSWMGTDGDAKGVMVKFDMPAAGAAPANAYEATTIAPEDWKCGNQSFKAKHVTYSNKTEMWTIPDNWPIVGTEKGTTVKMVTTGYSYEITNLGTDAKPELKWDSAKDAK